MTRTSVDAGALRHSAARQRRDEHLPTCLCQVAAAEFIKQQNLKQSTVLRCKYPSRDTKDGSQAQPETEEVGYDSVAVQPEISKLAGTQRPRWFKIGLE